VRLRDQLLGVTVASETKGKRLPLSEDASHPHRCTSCTEEYLQVPYLCHSCGSLFRPPAGLDHFGRFGLPVSFKLDFEELERRYLDLCRRLHPDKMINAPATVQSRALVLSSQLNESHRILADERARADYLVTLYGGPSAEREKHVPQAFLIEQMDLREELEEAQGDPQALSALLERVVPEELACLVRIRELFEGNGLPSQAVLTQIRRELNQLKYWTTLSGEIRHHLQAGGPCLP
jgi:molecular chaperone HscB